ncbi:hypothetical protein FS837_007522, partial [Tulasnella sp. UAMH 9824]
WKLEDELGQEEYLRIYDLWKDHRVIKQPTVDARGYQASRADITSRTVTYSIQGKEIQVIVKLANIILTPADPFYLGGSWHVEGMANERFVASGIYYYDCENIKESEPAFRVAINFEDVRYEQSDSLGISLVWNLDT